MENRHEMRAWFGGRFELTRGTPADYAGLERFHYRAGRPATWAGVWVVRYRVKHKDIKHKEENVGRVVAVGVLSYPCVNCAARDRALGLGGLSAEARLGFVNQNVRVISRVVVHPQFRSMGLASWVVRSICEQCDVRWVEAMAAMGRVHPLFVRGGMREAGAGRRGVVYYLWGRAGRRET